MPIGYSVCQNKLQNAQKIVVGGCSNTGYVGIYLGYCKIQGISLRYIFSLLSRYLQIRRVSKKQSSWITYELTRKIQERNYMKKIAFQENSTTAWERYKQARNEVSNSIKPAKN